MKINDTCLNELVRTILLINVMIVLIHPNISVFIFLSKVE